MFSAFQFQVSLQHVYTRKEPTSDNIYSMRHLLVPHIFACTKTEPHAELQQTVLQAFQYRQSDNFKSKSAFHSKKEAARCRKPTGLFKKKYRNAKTVVRKRDAKFCVPKRIYGSMNDDCYGKTGISISFSPAGQLRHNTLCDPAYTGNQGFQRS